MVGFEELTQQQCASFDGELGVFEPFTPQSDRYNNANRNGQIICLSAWHGDGNICIKPLSTVWRQLCGVSFASPFSGC
jgi:hypothetical protein